MNDGFNVVGRTKNFAKKKATDFVPPIGLRDGTAYYLFWKRQWIMFRDDQILVIGNRETDRYWLSSVCMLLNGFKEHITGYYLDFGFKAPRRRYARDVDYIGSGSMLEPLGGSETVLELIEGLKVEVPSLN